MLDCVIYELLLIYVQIYNDIIWIFFLVRQVSSLFVLLLTKTNSTYIIVYAMWIDNYNLV